MRLGGGLLGCLRFRGDSSLGASGLQRAVDRQAGGSERWEEQRPGGPSESFGGLGVPGRSLGAADGRLAVAPVREAGWLGPELVGRLVVG